MSGLSSAAELHPSMDDDYEDFSSSVTESSSLCSPSGIGQSTCHATPHYFRHLAHLIMFIIMFKDLKITT